MNLNIHSLVDSPLTRLLVCIACFPSRDFHHPFFLRFAADQTVGLRHAGYVIAVEDLVKDKSGEVVEIVASCKPSTEALKPKAFIQWVRIS